MSTTDKGRRARREVLDYFERHDYKTAVVEKTGRFVKVKDAFGLFDICAVHPTEGWVWVQVACGRPHSHAPYKRFAENHVIVNSGTTVKQFVRKRGAVFDIYKYTPMGNVIVQKDVDLRVL